MFDFSFWELAIVMIVALLVVGPDKLPALAAQLGRWIGKARKLVQSVRADIESEIRAAELQEMLNKQQNEIKELQTILSKNVSSEETADSKDKDDHALIKSIEDNLSSRKQVPSAHPESEER